VNIPRASPGDNTQPDCSRGSVVSTLEQSLRLLRDPSKGRPVRQEALKRFVHFAPDLHQPLHAIAEERGGIDVIMQSNGRQTDLHRLWEGEMIGRAIRANAPGIRVGHASDPELGSLASGPARGVGGEGALDVHAWVKMHNEIPTVGPRTVCKSKATSQAPGACGLSQESRHPWCTRRLGSVSGIARRIVCDAWQAGVRGDSTNARRVATQARVGRLRIGAMERLRGRHRQDRMRERGTSAPARNRLPRESGIF